MATDKEKLLEDGDRMIERFREVLTKVQTMYQTQLVAYEVQPTIASQQINRLKQEKQTMEEKMKICREDASFVFAGMWRSPLEASFNWMGGWRPTTSIVLAYSLMGMHIEDELLRLIHGIELPTMAALSANQLSALHSLQQTLSVAEDSMCNRIAVVQVYM